MHLYVELALMALYPVPDSCCWTGMKLGPGVRRVFAFCAFVSAYRMGQLEAGRPYPP